MLERRGELGEQRGKLGKLRLAGAHRRRALALEAGEAVEHVHGVVGAALLAVIDDVDAGLDLLRHDMRDRLLHRCGELGLALAGLVLLGEQKLDDFGCARQAAGMGGEDARGRTFHGATLMEGGGGIMWLRRRGRKGRAVAHRAGTAGGRFRPSQRVRHPRTACARPAHF